MRVERKNPNPQTNMPKTPKAVNVAVEILIDWLIATTQDDQHDTNEENEESEPDPSEHQSKEAGRV
jgi:hypothetical protein